MGSVEPKPIKLWAVVKTHLSGKREIIGTFEDFSCAYIAFMKSSTGEVPRLFADDACSFDIVRMIETSNE